MIQAFDQFRRQFSGDPRAVVQQLLASGKMSKQQFDQFSQMANQFQSLFK